MPGFLRKKEFEKVVRALWDKVKERFVEDVAFDDVTKILSKTKNGQTSNVIDLSTYAKKDEENHFTEDNLFKDVFLESVDPYVENLGNYTSVAGGVKKTGRRDFTSHSNGNSGYVESLLIRVRSDKNAGDTTNVSVWEVTKAQDASNDVANQIVTNTQMSVIDYGNGVKCIEVPISKKYQDETYFIFQLSPSTDMAYYDATSSIEDFIYIDGDLPVDGNNINTYKNQQYVGICGLTGDPIKVRDMITKNCVEEWQDLEHVEQYQYINLMDYNKKVTGYHYGGNGDVYVENTDWSTYFLDVTPGEQYTIMRKVDDSSRFVFTGSVGGTKIDAITVNTVHQSNGFSIRSLTVPNRAGITKLAIQFRHNENGLQDIMVVSGIHTTVGGFIPYADGNLIQIGTEVSHKFDNTGSNLGSTTISSAIKELDEKIANVGGAVTFDEPTRTLKQTINGVQSDVVTGLVREWQDLEHTTQSSIKNVFDKNTQVEDGKRYYFGNIENYAGCKIVKIPCKTNDEFTIIKGASHDSSQVGIYNADGTHLRQLNVNHNNVNGKEVYRFTIPSDLQDASYFVTTMYENHTDINSVMVFKENIADNNIPTNYVPFTDGATVLINSSEVALSFDGTGTNLSSSTIHSAIKELNGKIVNAGGGTVTSVNSVQPQPNGDVVLTSVITHPNNNILLQVGNQDFATLQCMTDQDATTIINGFTL